MREAIVVLSRKGFRATKVTAKEVRSREHARKLWPLVAPNAIHKMVTWVSPSFDENSKLVRRSHFRLMPHKSYDLKAVFDEEESSRQRAAAESQKHRQAKDYIAAELMRRLAAGLALPWSFKDPDASDYPLSGNLLLGADCVVTEHPLNTPFGSRFRLDVAVLGPPIEKAPMVLGAVEIELGHAFDGRKALIGKSLGFPLISIDITEMTLEQITPEWAQGALTATTRSHEEGRRQTYVYLHDLMYPLYAQLPRFLDREQRHQYLVFTDDITIRKIMKWLKRLATTLGYAKDVISVSIVNAKSEQSRKVLAHAGEVVGSEWEQFNNRQCLRITLPRPKGPTDLQSHRFHMTMARLLLSHAEALVGYQYCNGVGNHCPEEDVWTVRLINEEKTEFITHRILPKRLAEPINRLMKVVADLQRGDQEAG
ncbi:hypothetical protein ELE36_02515 [Pseudolysobacter antarcticus]|uniref:Uncharacterized protein n=1 Tax=Pseudolysobacter antarcticus TaxID=2511995 RepID=A0A411HFR3_9GAMM|nr:hypothetical protein [Pseudolysobacter antarcticus]QBB69336.1 hypothetical protein ELE36_02515 [Pseudolysobacter antarcticus]